MDHPDNLSTQRTRPILFSAPMVRALLAGTKTQTRRALDPDLFFSSGGAVVRMKGAGHGVTGITEAHCRYARQPGDRLWVRETWAQWGRRTVYRATCDYRPTGAGMWRPSIHMPRSASRITLEVIGLRVERLHDISRGDAMAEGCPFPNMASGPDPRQWYRNLWTEMHGAPSWSKNPWVWVIEFRVLPSVQGKQTAPERALHE